MIARAQRWIDVHELLAVPVLGGGMVALVTGLGFAWWSFCSALGILGA